MPATKEIVEGYAEYGELCCGGCGSADLRIETLDLLAARDPNGPWLVGCNECGCTVEITTGMLADATGMPTVE